MKRDVRIFLIDIIENIRKIEQYLDGIDEQAFLANEQMQDAVVRRIEVIGEAVKGIPLSIRKTFSDISWKELAGMRDVLIHQYFGVNLKRVWVVVREDLPVIKDKVLKILDELKGQDFLFNKE